MKNLKLLNLGLIALLVLLMSCSSEEPITESSSITVSANDVFNAIKDNNTKLLVRDDKGKDISKSAKIYVDGDAIEGNFFKFNELKTYKVHAVVGSSKSKEVDIKIVESTHTSKVLVEDYTGAWCGYCPRLAYKLDEISSRNSNVIPVAIHRGDALEFSGSGTLMRLFKVEGFPTGKVNRTEEWNESESQPLDELKEKKGLGLAINSKLDGTKLTATVKVDFDIDFDGENKLVVFLIENDIIMSQANYYNNDVSSPWYQKGNPITNFEHDYVARASLTNPIGNLIPNDKVGLGKTYNLDLELDLNSVRVNNLDKIELVAFVADKNNTVINVQKAKVGENKDFD